MAGAKREPSSLVQSTMRMGPLGLDLVLGEGAHDLQGAHDPEDAVEAAAPRLASRRGSRS